MCGLFGVLSTYLTKSEVDDFRTLAMLSMFRGVDSTGIAACVRGENKNKSKFEYPFIKDTQDALTFLNGDPTEALLKRDGKVALMGHTRYTTVGDTNVANAHPHKFKHLIGCHNGTINRFTYSEEHKKLGSDSRVLFHKIAEAGLEPALSEADYGAYCISFFNTKDQTLNFSRNDDRPLYFMFTKSGSTVYWASEERMLQFMAAGTRTQYQDPFFFKKGVLYSFQLGQDPQKGGSVTELKIDRPVFVYPGNYNRAEKSGWELDLDAYKDYHSRPLAGHNHYEGKQLNIENVGVGGYSYRGSKGRLMMPSEAEYYLSQGCAWCDEQKGLEHQVMWIDNDQFVCSSCCEEEYVKMFLFNAVKGELVPNLKDEEDGSCLH